GEAKKKRKRMSDAENRAQEMTNLLVYKGRLIEGVFAAYLMRNKIDAETTPVEYLVILRDAYMSGAEHLWSSIMATLDPGVEETPADLKRMDSIHIEMEKWRQDKLDAFAMAAPTAWNA